MKLGNGPRIQDWRSCAFGFQLPALANKAVPRPARASIAQCNGIKPGMTRTNTVWDDGTLAVVLSRFAPHERHAPHTDRYSRLTLTLRGGFEEEVRSRRVVVEPGEVLFKSHRVVHENRFGPSGAALASLVFKADVQRDSGLVLGWTVHREAKTSTLVFDALEAAFAGHSHAVRTAASDALAVQTEPPPRVAAPAWLQQLHEEFRSATLAEIDVAARAEAAGAHPAHASRLFRRCFGSSITQHALEQGVRRATALLARPDLRLADVAQQAGFYDQSHMNRVFRRVTRRTPGHYRAVLSQAAG